MVQTKRLSSLSAFESELGAVSRLVLVRLDQLNCEELQDVKFPSAGIPAASIVDDCSEVPTCVV